VPGAKQKGTHTIYKTKSKRKRLFVSKTKRLFVSARFSAENEKCFRFARAKRKQNESKTKAKQKQNGSKTEAKRKQNESKTKAKRKQNTAKRPFLNPAIELAG